MVKVAVRAVEQERGLELQITFPESTLATMLPIVIAIDPANVLKIEFFAARVEGIVSESVRDLKNDLFSARLVVNDNESARDFARPLDWEPARPIESNSDLSNELCSATVEARVRDPLRLAAESHPGVMISEAVETVVSVIVVGAIEAEY